MLSRIWQIVVKEFIQFIRDRILTLFLFLFPVTQLILVAQATGSGVIDLPTAILDQDGSRTSRSLAQALDNTEELALYAFPESIEATKRLLDEGQAGLAVVIPPNFERDLLSGGRLANAPRRKGNPDSGQAQLQIIADGANSIAADTALRTAEGAIRSRLAGLLATAGRPGPLDLRISVRFNQSLDTRDYAIPAQLAFIVYQVTLAVASLSLARERELGTLEQLAVAPLRRFELLTGKALPPAVIGFIDFIIMFLVIVGVYEVPMKGSWALLFLLSALFIAAEVSGGLMISALSRTQQQAVLTLFMVAIAEIMLSGYLVPVERLPIGLKVISLFSPIRHYMVILRSIMLKGADLLTLWPETLALLVLGAALAILSARNVARVFE